MNYDTQAFAEDMFMQGIRAAIQIVHAMAKHPDYPKEWMPAFHEVAGKLGKVNVSLEKRGEDGKYPSDQEAK